MLICDFLTPGGNRRSSLMLYIGDFGSWLLIASTHRWFRHGFVLESVDSAMTPYGMMRAIHDYCATSVCLDACPPLVALSGWSAEPSIGDDREAQGVEQLVHVCSGRFVWCVDLSAIGRGVMVVATAGFVTMGLLLVRTTSNGYGMS